MRLPLYIIPGLLILLILSTLGFGQTKETVVKATEGYLQGADRDSIYYRVIGNGPDSVVVVHGGPGAGMYSILPDIKPLAEHVTLIFYDQRGGGRSVLPKDRSKLRPKYFVEDLEAVRRYFKLDKMNIFTHSFGAILAAEYSQQHPKKLKRIVFHSATGATRSAAANYYKDRARQDTSSIDTTLTNKASHLLQLLLQGTAKNPRKICRKYEAVTRKIARLRGTSIHYQGTTCQAPSEAVKYYYQITAQLVPRYFGDWNYISTVDHISAPVLIIHGKNDPAGVAMQNSWIRTYPNSQLLKVPNAGKSAISDNPDFVIEALVEFYKGE